MPEQQTEDLYLRVGGQWPSATGVPLLPPYYAYLLKLSSRVGLVDIYPWIAEVLFHSDVVTGSEAIQPSDQAGPIGAPPNVISFFIDDHKDNIANAMASGESAADGHEWQDDFARYCWHQVHEQGGRSDRAPRLFVVDTYGEFAKPETLNERIEFSIGLERAIGEDHRFDAAASSIPLYTRSALAGAGNPARMLQKFAALGRIRGVPPASGDQRSALGNLNVFVFNSITYLTRTIGFREAMQLIRAILERGVWKPNPPASDGGQLQDRDGLLFAILHEGVHTPDQIRYAETFFDGVIAFDAYRPPGQSQRKIAYGFEQFPLARARATGTSDGSAPALDPFLFEPDYAHAHCYPPRGGARLAPEADRIPKEKIWPLDPRRGQQAADGKSDDEEGQ